MVLNTSPRKWAKPASVIGAFGLLAASTVLLTGTGQQAHAATTYQSKCDTITGGGPANLPTICWLDFASLSTSNLQAGTAIPISVTLPGGQIATMTLSTGTNMSVNGVATQLGTQSGGTLSNFATSNITMSGVPYITSESANALTTTSFGTAANPTVTNTLTMSNITVDNADGTPTTSFYMVNMAGSLAVFTGASLPAGFSFAAGDQDTSDVPITNLGSLAVVTGGTDPTTSGDGTKTFTTLNDPAPNEPDGTNREFPAAHNPTTFSESAVLAGTYTTDPASTSGMGGDFQFGIFLPPAVNFDANGGLNAPSPVSADLAGDATIPTGSDPTYSGYTFTGWNTAADGTGTAYTDGASMTNITADTTLYAQWTKNATYTVAFDPNGGTGGPASITDIASGGTASIPTGSDPTYSGYTFTGWNTAKDGSGTPYADGATVSGITADVTLYAQWTPVVVPATYTLTFDPNGGAGGPAAITGIASGANETIPTGSDPTYSGYTFTGWNTCPQSSGVADSPTATPADTTTPASIPTGAAGCVDHVSYKDGDTISGINADMTLYAQWTVIPTPTTPPTTPTLAFTGTNTGLIAGAAGVAVAMASLGGFAIWRRKRTN